MQHRLITLSAIEIREHWMLKLLNAASRRSQVARGESIKCYDTIAYLSHSGIRIENRLRCLSIREIS